MRSWSFSLNVLKPVEQKSPKLQKVELKLVGISVIFFLIFFFCLSRFPFPKGSVIFTFHFAVGYKWFYFYPLFIFWVFWDSVSYSKMVWNSLRGWGWPWTSSCLHLQNAEVLKHSSATRPIGWCFTFEYKILKRAKQLLSYRGFISILLITYFKQISRRRSTVN